VRILIVGGTGLISSAIVRFLAERGDEVTVYNRARREGELPGSVRRLVGDRTRFEEFERQMAAAGRFDCVIDMVCYSPEEAASAIRAFRGRTSQYVFCSTVDVYTKPARRYPVREGDERRPSGEFPYAANKAVCETLLLEAHGRGDLPVTVIRPAQTYGEGGSLIHTLGWGTYFLDRIRRGMPVVVHGDGNSLWCACHRDDVARAFVGAAGNASALGKAYNATGEEWMTWNAYVEGIAEAMGAPRPKLVHIPTDLLGRLAPKRAEWCVKNFQFDNVFDNSAARSELGFRYTIPWVEGARRTVRWLDERGRIEPAESQPFYDKLLAAWERAGDRLAQELGDLDG